MEGIQSEARPVFIHALWRTGSTYIWTKFRREARYWAYYEPLNEQLIHSSESLRLVYAPETVGSLRHPPSRDPFCFREYPFRPEDGVEYFEKSLSCERYCLDEDSTDEALRRYIANLVDYARSQQRVPVLQFNRALLRSRWLTRQFNPVNILLLRRPMDIWKSFLSFPESPFVMMLCLVLGQNRTSSPLNALDRWSEVPFYVGETIEQDHAFYGSYAHEHMDTLYPLFYAFYLLTCLANVPIADCILDMTEITENPEARAAAERRLRELGMEISLEDCKLPTYTNLLPSDREWVAYESVTRKLLASRLPSSLALSPDLLRVHQPMLGAYFREALSDFVLHSEARDPRSLAGNNGDHQYRPDSVAAVSSDARDGQGLALFEDGQYGEALATIEESLGQRETAQRWSDWGVLQRTLGHRVNAERGFRRALELDPKLAVAGNNLGVILFEAGRLEEAAPYLRQAHQTSNGTGNGAAKGGDYMLSRMLAECEATSIAPPVSESESALLDAHRRYDASLAELRMMAQRLVVKFPQSREARFLLAQVFQASGHNRMALTEYEQLSQNAPANERRRVEQAIRQCEADRDYFPPEYEQWVESIVGVNAATWKSYVRREIQRGREFVRIVRERIPVVGRRVLDVGCGYAGTVITFAEAGAKVVGIDADETRVRMGRKRLADLGIEADCRRDDICAEGIERRLGTFDVIVAQDVLEHVLVLEQAICGLSSLLRPGGVLLLQIGNKYAPDQLLADHHYGRAGITLLARSQAMEYFRLATGLDDDAYGIGFLRTERYYRKAFARFGIVLEHAGNFDRAPDASWYSRSMEQVRRRAEQDIYPGLRPELQQRVRRRMKSVVRYFGQIEDLISQYESSPEMRAKIDVRLVQRICAPVWRLIGTKPAQTAAVSAPGSAPVGPGLAPASSQLPAPDHCQEAGASPGPTGAPQTVEEFMVAAGRVPGIDPDLPDYMKEALTPRPVDSGFYVKSCYQLLRALPEDLRPLAIKALKEASSRDYRLGLVVALNHLLAGDRKAAIPILSSAVAINSLDRYAEDLLVATETALAEKEGQPRSRFSGLQDYLAGSFCPNPWKQFSLECDGHFGMCCNAWLVVPIGHVNKSSPLEAWNSEMAQEIRKSILDGSFRYCSKIHCSAIAGRSLPSRTSAEVVQILASASSGSSERLPAPLPVVECVTERKSAGQAPALELMVARGSDLMIKTGPQTVALAFDLTCNLACPSCRRDFYVASKEEQWRIERVHNQLSSEFLKDAREIYMDGAGEVFASRPSRRLLKELTRERYPNLRFWLITNGQLFNRRAFEEFDLKGRINRLSISIDAATDATYQFVRRGGSFDRLLSNLTFIDELRQNEGERFSLILGFVVAAWNFREIGDFVRLGKGFHANNIHFTLIRNNVGYSDQQFSEMCIGSPTHPRHQEFLQALQDPVLDDRVVGGSIMAFRKRSPTSG